MTFALFFTGAALLVLLTASVLTASRDPRGTTSRQRSAPDAVVTKPAPGEHDSRGTVRPRTPVSVPPQARSTPARRERASLADIAGAATDTTLRRVLSEAVTSGGIPVVAPRSAHSAEHVHGRHTARPVPLPQNYVRRIPVAGEAADSIPHSRPASETDLATAS